jgi:hypothetical protein
MMMFHEIMAPRLFRRTDQSTHGYFGRDWKHPNDSFKVQPHV